MTDRSDAMKSADAFKDLAEVEFDNASDIQAYLKRVRDLSKTFAVELEFAAEDLEARLRAVPPASEEDTGVVMARKAMRTAKHLKRSAEAARNVGTSASKTWGALKTHFEDQMGGRKEKTRKTIDLES
ncbi:hypothetical protein GCM10027570_31140 [Streptomonospora sediminis]